MFMCWIKIKNVFLFVVFPSKWKENASNLENVKVWEWYAAAAPHDPPITLIDCSYIWWIWLCRNVISLQQRQLSLKERISPDFTAYIVDGDFHFTSQWKVAGRAYSVIFTSLKVLIGQNTPECQRLWVLLRKHFQNAKPSWYQCLDSCPEYDNGRWHKNLLSLLQWVVARGQSFLSHSSLKWQDVTVQRGCNAVGSQFNSQQIHLKLSNYLHSHFCSSQFRKTVLIWL